MYGARHVRAKGTEKTAYWWREAKVLYQKEPLNNLPGHNMKSIDKITEILAATKDGTLLAPGHLALLQMMANAPLHQVTESSEQALDELHAMVLSGNYSSSRAWFHHIEHLTQDHEGYVYWKGRHVEHYSFSDGVREKAAAEKLALACRTLELKGFPVTARNAAEDACLEAPADTPWKLALQNYYSFFENKEQVVGIFYHRQARTAGAVPGVPFCPVISVTMTEGKVEVTPHEGAYEAFHALHNKGLHALSAQPSYTELVGRLTRMAVAPALLELALEGY
jgi:hypothetical protein